MSEEFAVSAEKVAEATKAGIEVLEALLSQYKYQFERQQKAVFASINEWEAIRQGLAEEAAHLRRQLSTPKSFAGLGGMSEGARAQVEAALLLVEQRHASHDPWSIPQPLGELAQEEIVRLRALRGAALMALSELRVTPANATKLGEIAEGVFASAWRARFESVYGAVEQLDAPAY